MRINSYLYMLHMCGFPFDFGLSAYKFFFFFCSLMYCFLTLCYLLLVYLLIWWDWGSNSGLHGCKTSRLPPELHLQSILLWLFWRWSLLSYLLKLASNHDPPDLSLPGVNHWCPALLSLLNLNGLPSTDLTAICCLYWHWLYLFVYLMTELMKKSQSGVKMLELQLQLYWLPAI
jgi:hypothetical protein